MESSDEIYSVVTPESLPRPWMSAEWACFWMQGKPATPLLIDVKVDQLWGPMQAMQAVNLLDASSVAWLLRSIAGKTGVEPTEGIRPLTNEIVREVPRIRTRQAMGDLERAARLIQANLRSGTENINARAVQTFIMHDRMDELLDMATSPSAASVKQRQIAVALVDLGRIGEAAQIAEVMQNRAEVRTVCARIVEHIPRGASASSGEWEALDRLHPRLGPPQRRDVLEIMDRCGVAPLGRWAAIPSLQELRQARLEADINTKRQSDQAAGSCEHRPGQLGSKNSSIQGSTGMHGLFIMSALADARPRAEGAPNGGSRVRNS